MVVGLRERKKEATRDALIRSAITQFADRGFDHVTVEDIADACDVSPRTFFRYFGAKEDVLFADSDAHCARIIERLGERAEDEPLLDALQRAVVRVAGEYEQDRELKVRRHHIISTTPSLERRLAERSQTWDAQILEALRPRKRLDLDEELRLRLTVATATTALRVASELWISRGGKGDLTKVLAAALDTLRDGIR